MVWTGDCNAAVIRVEVQLSIIDMAPSFNVVVGLGALNLRSKSGSDISEEDGLHRSDSSDRGP